MQVTQWSVWSQWAPTSSGQRLMWFPHHGLDHFVHNIISPSLIVSRRAAQWLVVDLCICFHVFQNEGSQGLCTVGWLFFFFTSNIYLWVSTCYICLSGSGIPQSGWFFLVLSIFLTISRCHFFSWWLVLHCVNVPHFLYPSFSWGASRLFPGSGCCD